MFDDEAELGSNDEDNDDIRKVINKRDVEENEEGLDKDLQDFIVAGDAEVIGDNEVDAYNKFIEDINIDDHRRKIAEMNAVIYGRNKKRKRGEVEGLDN